MLTLPTDATRLACECGRGIRCTISYEGRRLGLLAFFDDPQPGEIHGKPLANCPGCGARLDHRLLVEAFSVRALPSGDGPNGVHRAGPSGAQRGRPQPMVASHTIAKG
jgi:hypothetical protein